jgi:hypothetical protein
MESATPTDITPTAPARPRMPCELVICVAEYLIQGGKYGTYADLRLLDSFCRDALLLLEKRFLVIELDDIDRLEEIAKQPGSEHVQ